MDDTTHRPLILIVDDELLIRESLAEALAESGYETLTAAEGEEALALFEARNVAAIVTDMYMGGSDGFVLINALRSRGETVPIIVMSGGQPELARTLGADATLTKPFRARQLESLLDSLLDRAAA
ncbi:response regulator transcription factor [Dongia sp.]|uniref:response regulator transcription factor n=1 Tax=Dongia sp. TaxID=1977262 RepID=UPI003750C853